MDTYGDMLCLTKRDTEDLHMNKTKRMENALAALFLTIFAMPFFGGYMMLSEEGEHKLLGALLLVVGIMIWVWFGIR